MSNVPSDRLPLAVEVGREPDVFGQLRCFFEIGDGLFRVVHHLIGRLEIVLQIDPRDRCLDALGVAWRQVADVPDAGHHEVVLAQVFIDRLSLGRRFDDH